MIFGHISWASLFCEVSSFCVLHSHLTKIGTLATLSIHNTFYLHLYFFPGWECAPASPVWASPVLLLPLDENKRTSMTGAGLTLHTRPTELTLKVVLKNLWLVQMKWIGNSHPLSPEACLLGMVQMILFLLSFSHNNFNYLLYFESMSLDRFQPLKGFFFFE